MDGALQASSENTIVLFVSPPKFCVSIVSSFSRDLQWSQEKTKTMLMQNLGGQTKSIMLFSELAYWLAVMVCVINGFRPEKCKRIDLFSHAHNIPISAVTFSWGGGGVETHIFCKKKHFL